MAVATPIRNRVSNPSVELDTAHWSSGASSAIDPVSGRSALWSAAGGWSYRFRTTIANGGYGFVDVAGAEVDAGEYVSARIRARINTDFPAGTIAALITWWASGAQIGQTGVLATSGSGLAGEYDLVIEGVQAPPGADECVLRAILNTGLAGTYDVSFDAVSVIGAAEMAEYHDGDSPFSEWDGPPHASPSTFYGPRQRVMTPAGQALLDQYPFALQRSHLVRAICNANGEEFVLLDEALSTLQSNTIAMTAEEFLGLFEDALGMSVNNPGMTVSERKDAVIAFMTRAAMTGSSWDWQRVATQILGNGWRWEVGGTRNSVLTVFMPYAAGSLKAELAEALLVTITPATMVINVTYSQGFILDEALLDEDLM